MELSEPIAISKRATFQNRLVATVIKNYMERMSHVNNFFGSCRIIGDAEWFQRGVMIGFTGFNINRRLVVSIGNGIQLAPLVSSIFTGATQTTMALSTPWMELDILESFT